MAAQHTSTTVSDDPHAPLNERERHGSDSVEREPLERDTTPTTPEAKYEEECRRSRHVWFSGYFTGSPYVAPPPPSANEHDLSEIKREELLTEKTYVIPRGYIYHGNELPRIMQAVPRGSLHKGLVIYISLACVAFIFLLVAACPVPWYRGRNVTVDGVNYKGVQFTLWWQKGGNLPKITTRHLRSCPLQKEFFQSISASIIMACVFTLCSIITAGAKLRGSGGYGPTLLFAFLGFIWSICGCAMSISQFHLDRCTNPRFPRIARLDAGFALSLLAWIFLLVGLIVLIGVTRLNIGPILKRHRPMDTYYVLLMTVALLFTVVGNATTIWKRHFGDANVKVVRVTYWHTELITGDGVSLLYGRAHYRCPAFTKRIKASIAFLILGSVTLFLAAMLGVRAHVKRPARIFACIMGILSSVFLIISWVTSIAVFYRKLCVGPVTGSVYENYPGVPSGIFLGSTHFSGYGVQEGVILVILAWIICTAAVIANIVVPWNDRDSYFDRQQA